MREDRNSPWMFLPRSTRFVEKTLEPARRTFEVNNHSDAPALRTIDPLSEVRHATGQIQ
jgi:hypothetical protein